MEKKLSKKYWLIVMTSFKSDESFLEKISIGAIGAKKVFEYLQNQELDPIELERGSMNYKIWKKIKIKRIRVPDILCVRCGIRIESRAKTKLEISMSHSLSDPERGWDYGMKDNDYVAFVVCDKIGERPIDWQADNLIQFVSIKNLRLAEKEKMVLYVKPKGSEEGFEARITWPAATASADGIIKESTAERIQYEREKDGRIISLKTSKKGLKMIPLVHTGDIVHKNQVLASVIPVSMTFSCDSVDYNYFLGNLSNPALSERYTASKALSFFNNSEVQTNLSSLLDNPDEHIYVKLEAAASLARFGISQGYNFIKKCIGSSYLQNVLESVIVLAEIKTDTSCKMLCDILNDNNNDPEIRAAAAWGIGELKNKTALDALVRSFSEVNENIKIEAARSLAKLTKNYSPEILNSFTKSTAIQKPGIAWALTKSNSIVLDQLINALSDDDSKHWISYIIGTQGESRYITDIEKLKTKYPEVYFAVTVLWKIMTSWVYKLNEY
ncbi:HEAT repeat domain-containing protein [Candidatus Magnetobacterium casense]|uniref:HEAT repeat domain-containing protein n=1 Tax=Candidatus Magnetobacterium casense TaxID=1455061 RepID=UPI00058F9A10|nr:HEAT repeat domain-containing protein [Candidatus Magnetobacterium casensis]